MMVYQNILYYVIFLVNKIFLSMKKIKYLFINIIKKNKNQKNYILIIMIKNLMIIQIKINPSKTLVLIYGQIYSYSKNLKSISIPMINSNEHFVKNGWINALDIDCIALLRHKCVWKNGIYKTDDHDPNADGCCGVC